LGTRQCFDVDYITSGSNIYTSSLDGRLCFPSSRRPINSISPSSLRSKSNHSAEQRSTSPTRISTIDRKYTMDAIPHLLARANENGNCTQATCPVEYSIYGYRPNLGSVIFFLALFAISGAVYVWQGVKTRTKFFVGLPNTGGRGCEANAPCSRRLARW